MKSTVTLVACLTILLTVAPAPIRAGVTYTYVFTSLGVGTPSPSKGVEDAELVLNNLPATTLSDFQSFHMLPGNDLGAPEFTLTPTRLEGLGVIQDAAKTGITSPAVPPTLIDSLDFTIHPPNVTFDVLNVQWGGAEIEPLSPDAIIIINMVVNGAIPHPDIEVLGDWDLAPNTAVPEPTSLILWGSAAVFAWGFRKRQKNLAKPPAIHAILPSITAETPARAAPEYSPGRSP